MEDYFYTMRKIRNQIQKKYNIDAVRLAEMLSNAGFSELSDEICDRIEFLKQVYSEVDLDDEAWRIVRYSKEDFIERYNCFLEYTGKIPCKVSHLDFTPKKAEEYLSFFRGLELHKSEQDTAMKEVVELGCVAKCIEDARKIVDELENFEMSKEERNYFIAENAAFLFNDYTRNAGQIFSSLCKKYGKTEGFIYLKEHPQLIRLGILVQ